MNKNTKYVGMIWGGLLATLLFVGCGSDNRESALQENGRTPAAGHVTAEKNQAPVIQSLEVFPDQLRTGVQAEARVEAIDSEGDSLSYGYEWAVNGRRIGGGDQSFVLKDVRKGQTLQLTVIVSDGTHEVRSSTFATIANSAPELGSVSLDRTGEQGLLATPRAADPDLDSVSFRYRWTVNGRDEDADGPVLDLSELKGGDEVRVEVVATDGEDEGRSVMSDPFIIGNAKPVIVSTPDSIVIEGNTLSYQLRANDSDSGQRLHYRLEEGPEGMVLDPLLGDLSWTPGPDQVGEFSVRIAVEDLNGGIAKQSFSVTAGQE